MKKTLLNLLGLALFTGTLSAHAAITEPKPARSTAPKINRTLSSKHNVSRSNTCGQDTLFYPLYKELAFGSQDSIFIDELQSDLNRTAATVYDIPANVTINGAAFYAIAVGAPITARVVLCPVSTLTGMPNSGIELAADTITLTPGGSYVNSVTFSTPYVVNSSQKVAVLIKYDALAPGASLYVFMNDAGSPEQGAYPGEGLSFRRYADGSWNKMIDYAGQDEEYLVFPVVQYSINAGAGLPMMACQGTQVSINYTGGTDEILDSRFFNFRAFINYWGGTDDSTYVVVTDKGDTAWGNPANITFNTPGMNAVTAGVNLVNNHFDVCTDFTSPTPVLVRPLKTWYRDYDGDSYGDLNNKALDCDQIPGYVADSTDCNDSSMVLHQPIPYFVDADGDGFGDANATANYMCTLPPVQGYATNYLDCNDADSLINPNTVWYADTDGDGYGDVNTDSTSCTQPVGYVLDKTDCNDADANINPSVLVYEDADGDGYGNSNVSMDICTAPIGWVPNSDDCDDNNAAIVTYTWYADTDVDGFGDPNNSITACTQPVGYVSDNTDCDDNDSTVNPNTVWYADTDGDGYGNLASPMASCTQPLGFVLNSNDCDDTDPLVYGPITYYADADGDGFGDATDSVVSCVPVPGYITNNTDCDDNDAAIFQSEVVYIDADGDGYDAGQTTICYDGVTLPTGSSLTTLGHDCNDNDTTITAATDVWYADADGDGLGDANASTTACTQPNGYVANNTDCDDTDDQVGVATVWYADADGDFYGDANTTITACTKPNGYVANNTDCDDTDDQVGAATVWYADTDGDGFGDANASTTACTQPNGYVANNTDCDDTDDQVGVATVWYADADGDGLGDANASTTACTQPNGYVANNTDCDDNDDQVGVATVWYADADGDFYGDANTTVTACTKPNGYVANNTDCDDTDDQVGAATVWYADTDGDGFGDANASTTACTQPNGYVANNTDCDDNDGQVGVATVWYADADGDGFGDANASTTACTQPNGYVANNTDCDDTDDQVGVATTVWYADTDGDGFGDANTTTTACTAPSGYVADNTDCDDTDGAKFPTVLDSTFIIDNSGDPAFVFVADALDATTYEWSIDNTVAGTDTVLNHTFTLDGTYSVTLNVTDGCGNVYTSTQTVNVLNTSLSVLRNTKLAVYPSPANQYINVTGLTGTVLVEVATINGQVVKQVSNDFGKTAILQINTNELINGVYFVKVVSTQGVKTIKFSVAH